MDIDVLLQNLDLSEDQELEFKAASEGLPKSLWETASAFANTDGGYIVLGVSEDRNGFAISGVKNVNTLIQDFWNLHNNTQKLNLPICSNADVVSQRVAGKDLIIIRVPRASRTQKPIYINNNPKTGTYKRNYEGDYTCSEEELRQMMRDASNDPQDLQILEKFDLSDLDQNALKAYRQRFSSREPDHPSLALDDKGLLQQIGGWHQNRNSGQEGLTIAGLLMFGRELSIRDALPYHHLDYQERLSIDPEQRWTYRLTLDGRWEPNLFNFYFQVYGRLVKDLAVPFQLDNQAVRLGETHVHEALREALVNCLIHADHLSSRPLTILKFPDGFTFSNPGRLRISLKSLYTGGATDPRNPNLQRMFQMLGLGEKAGSGFQKILRAWTEQQWWPLVYEDLDLEVTSVNLPMVSMIPEEVIGVLKELVGDEYATLPELERIALALAHRFGEIRNKDIQQYKNEHPRTIGECLKRLVQKGWLQQSGRSRGTSYTLSSCQDTDQLSLLPSSEHSAVDSEHSAVDSEHSAVDSEHSAVDSEHSASDKDNQLLFDIAEPIRSQGRSDPQLLRDIVLQLCFGRYLSLRQLAKFLGRSSDTVRTHYITPLVSEELLELRYPDQPKHSQQAYRTQSAVKLDDANQPPISRKSQSV
jgi:ATP-dependent DNA helicase RecG